MELLKSIPFDNVFHKTFEALLIYQLCRPQIQPISQCIFLVLAKIDLINIRPRFPHAINRQTGKQDCDRP